MIEKVLSFEHKPPVTRNQSPDGYRNIIHVHCSKKGYHLDADIAPVIWSYTQAGSALRTALLMVFEPLMTMQPADTLLLKLFGSGKGGGAALQFAVLWLMGSGVCLLFRGDQHIHRLEEQKTSTGFGIFPILCLSFILLPMAVSPFASGSQIHRTQ